MKHKTTFRGVVISESRLVRKVVRPATPPPPPAQQKVRVGREVAGRGGKGVTVVAGLALPGVELEALAGELKRACGAGGAVRDGRIEIQGEQRDRVVAELVKRGYAAKRAGG
jgi:translation initiation factor 1